MSVDLRAALRAPHRASRDEALALDTFDVHGGHPHLRIRDAAVCLRCEAKECTFACPAENYRVEDDGRVSLQWEGCLECGTCRVICPHANVCWKYPDGGYGVRYRYG
jgi:ferredoxin like protein